MAGIVFSGAASHVPFITALPDAPDRALRDQVYGAMRELSAKLHAAKPDLLVVVSADHFINLFVDRMPPFCVGVADSYSGPVEDWIKLPRVTISAAREFATQLLETGLDSSFDLAFSSEIKLEHGFMVPLSFATPDFDIPIVPIVQNCIVPPLPRMKRCFAFGQLIREVAERSGKRVAVLGTGGLSHSPGAPEAGYIDEAFDREFLDIISSSSPTRALDIPNERIDAAGFGTWEIRQWCTAFGAADGGRAEVLTYVPIKQWETGCAVATFELPARSLQ